MWKLAHMDEWIDSRNPKIDLHRYGASAFFLDARIYPQIWLYRSAERVRPLTINTHIISLFCMREQLVF